MPGRGLSRGLSSLLRGWGRRRDRARPAAGADDLVPACARVREVGLNDGLFQAFFDKPEFKEQMLSWLTKSLYDGIRKEHGESA